MNDDVAKRLAASERNVLRMFGGVKANENWRKRYNNEVMQMFRDSDIINKTTNVMQLGAIVFIILLG